MSQSAKISHFEFLEREWDALCSKAGRIPSAMLEKTNCPVCGALKQTKIFEKKGLNFVQCPKCTHVFINPRLKASVLAKHFAKSRAWDVWAKEVLTTGEQAKRDRAKYTLAIQQVARLTKGKKIRILDVGCSSGIFLSMAAQKGWETAGVEPSQSAAAYAQEHFGLAVQCGNFLDLKVEGRFDVISFWASLEYNLDVQKVMKKVDTLLKPGGLLLIFISGNSHSLIMRMLKAECVGFVFNRTHSFSPQSLDTLTASYGYKKAASTSMLPETSVIENYLSYAPAYAVPRRSVLDKKSRQALERLITDNMMGYKFLSIYRKR